MAAALGAGLGSAARATQPPPDGPALLAALRAGGLVIFMRHSLTQRLGQPDDDLSSCVRQRNLTPEGERLATAIGHRIRALAIPVGVVESSPYCRCVDTARLAFGRVEVAGFLETSGDVGEPAEQARLARLAQVLQQAPKGGNRVLVAHGNNLYGLVERHGYASLRIAEGESVLFEPAAGMARVLARVTADAWAALG